MFKFKRSSLKEKQQPPELKVTESVVKTVVSIPHSNIVANDALLLKIFLALPGRLHAMECTTAYDFDTSGISLKRLFKAAEHQEDSILFIKTSSGSVFGAYCNEAWTMCKPRSFYGSGECFLFSIYQDKLHLYPWTGANEFFMNSSSNHVAMGAGGDFAFYLDGELNGGTSGPCETFGNTSSLCETPDFQVDRLELFVFKPRLSLKMN